MGQIMEKLFIPPSELQAGWEGDIHLIYLFATYAFVLKVGGELITEGSELLLLIPSIAPLVGAAVLPCTGAIPDSAVLIFSGLGSNKTKIQEEVTIGIGALAGATIAMLSVFFSVGMFAARVDQDETGEGGTYSSKPKLSKSLGETGLSVKWDAVRYNALTMIATLLPMFVIQIPACFARCTLEDEQSDCHTPKVAAIVALVLCVIFFVLYIYSQVRRANKGKDKIVNMKIQRVQEKSIARRIISARALFLDTDEKQHQLKRRIQARRAALGIVGAQVAPSPTKGGSSDGGAFLASPAGGGGGEPGEPLLPISMNNHQFETVVRRVFNHFDNNRTGYLEPIELVGVLNALGEKVDNKTLQKYLVEMDEDGDGRLSLLDFITVMTRAREEEIAASRNASPLLDQTSSPSHQHQHHHHDPNSPHHHHHSHPSSPITEQGGAGGKQQQKSTSGVFGTSSTSKRASSNFDERSPETASPASQYPTTRKNATTAASAAAGGSGEEGEELNNSEIKKTPSLAHVMSRAASSSTPCQPKNETNNKEEAENNSLHQRSKSAALNTTSASSGRNAGTLWKKVQTNHKVLKQQELAASGGVKSKIKGGKGIRPPPISIVSPQILPPVAPTAAAGETAVGGMSYDDNNNNTSLNDATSLTHYTAAVTQGGGGGAGNGVTSFAQNAAGIAGLRNSSSSSSSSSDSDVEMPKDLTDLPPEEQRRRVWIRSFSMMGLGAFLVVLFTDPLIGVLNEASKRTGIPNFYVALVIAPVVSSGPELLATYTYAAKKSINSATISIGSLLATVALNNTLCLSIFLAIVVLQDLKWVFTAEVLSMIFVELLSFGLVFFLGNRFWKTNYLFVAALLLPLSVALVAGLHTAGLD